MKTLGLLVVTLCSSFAMAQTAVKPKPMVRPSTPEAVAPGMNRAIVPSTGAVTSIEAFRAAQAAKQETSAKPAVACSVEQFGTDLAAGTRFKKEDAIYVTRLNIMRQGNCSGGVTTYDSEARENVIAAALVVAEEVHGKDVVNELNDSEKAQLDTMWAKGLASAKNFKAANDNQVTVASQIPVARQIKEACAIRN